MQANNALQNDQPIRTSRTSSLQVTFSAKQDTTLQSRDFRANYNTDCPPSRVASKYVQGYIINEVPSSTGRLKKHL